MTGKKEEKLLKMLIEYLGIDANIYLICHPGYNIT